MTGFMAWPNLIGSAADAIRSPGKRGLTWLSAAININRINASTVPGAHGT